MLCLSVHGRPQSMGVQPQFPGVNKALLPATVHRLMGLLRIGWTCCFLLTLFLSLSEAQTTCGALHTEAGVFICYPNPAEDKSNLVLPDVFHLSAQINAPAGKTISRYAVFIDGRLIQDTRISVPMQTVSIESNPRSPFSSGSHDLRVVAGALGSAEVKGIQFKSSDDPSFAIHSRALTSVSLEHQRSFVLVATCFGRRNS